MNGPRGAQPTQTAEAEYNPLFDSSPHRIAPPAPPLPPEPTRASRARHVLIAVALGSVLLVGLACAAVFITLENLGSNIPRVPNVFNGLDNAQRPVPLADRVSFLIMGTDSRQNTVQRSDDVLMLARVDVDLDPSNTRASVVSIPRDSWVDVPDHGPNTISAAYGLGGPSLLVRTVEQLTHVRVDHFAIIDFAGFQQMVDAIGGIDVQSAAGGPAHLDGRAALDYVTAGAGGPAGYRDRLNRQQTALRALLDQATSGGILTDPAKLLRLLDSLSHAVSLDETLTNSTLTGLGLQMRGLRTSAIGFVVSPVKGVGRERGQTVILLDQPRSEVLWNAVRDDTVDAYLKQFPGDSIKAPR